MARTIMTCVCLERPHSRWRSFGGSPTARDARTNGQAEAGLEGAIAEETEPLEA